MKLHDIKPLTESLIVTDEHLRQARGNKFNFLVNMSARDFLLLTTTNDESLQNIIEDSKTVDEYNAFANSGDNIIMPFLNVERGKVTGHEGRHRAGGLLKENEKANMVVAIKYRSANKEEEEQLADKHGIWRVEYDVDYEDMPSSIQGQFGRGVVPRSNMSFVRHLQK